MIPLVDLKKQYQSLKPEILKAIEEVLDETGFINGPRVKAFEETFAQMSEAQYGVGASSGTTALHLALAALGVGAGDEVITVAHTFIATAEAISQTGATIRFVDIDPETYTLDPSLLEKAITPKTRAIIPVHIYGHPCAMDAIQAIAKKHNLYVIYDAAQAHLARYKDQGLGRFGDAVCYSFYPGKNLGAYGDAGLVTTNNKDLADKMRMLSNHGRQTKYTHEVPGYNYRMDALQAAILNVKLKYLPDWTLQRQESARQYSDLLANMNIQTPKTSRDCTHAFHLYVIQASDREALAVHLKADGIASGVHYPVPLHLQPAYQSLNYRAGDFPVTESIAQRILSLPLFPELSYADCQRIVASLQRYEAVSSANV